MHLAQVAASPFTKMSNADEMSKMVRQYCAQPALPSPPLLGADCQMWTLRRANCGLTQAKMREMRKQRQTEEKRMKQRLTGAVAGLTAGKRVASQLNEGQEAKAKRLDDSDVEERIGLARSAGARRGAIVDTAGRVVSIRTQLAHDESVVRAEGVGQAKEMLVNYEEQLKAAHGKTVPPGLTLDDHVRHMEDFHTSQSASQSGFSPTGGLAIRKGDAYVGVLIWKEGRNKHGTILVIHVRAAVRRQQLAEVMWFHARQSLLGLKIAITAARCQAPAATRLWMRLGFQGASVDDAAMAVAVGSRKARRPIEPGHYQWSATVGEGPEAERWERPA